MCVQVDMRPSEDIKQLLRSLAEHHSFFIVSGRVCEELQPWFADVPAVGIAAEHGFRVKEPGSGDYAEQYPGLDFSWKDIVRPIMRMYAESTDGTHVQEKACGMTWAYSAADPDFGRWQVRRCALMHACCVVAPARNFGRGLRGGLRVCRRHAYASGGALGAPREVRARS